MRPTDRQMLHDYATSQDRMTRHQTRRSLSLSPLHPANRELLVAYMRGLCALGIVGLAAWVLWHILRAF